MKLATFIGGVAGLLLLLWLAVRADIPALLGVVAAGGWKLLWLLPYRSLFFALYAGGWSLLLQTNRDPVPVSGGYIFWVTSVREAVDRLLPVASVGGSVVGLRLMRWRGLDFSLIGATIITEIVLTLIVSYLFAAAGLMLLANHGVAPREYRSVFLTLLVSLPVLLAAIVLLREGSVFVLLDTGARKLLGRRVYDDHAGKLSSQVRLMFRRRARLTLAGGLELLAMISGSFEVWFAIRCFGQPVTVTDAIILESMTVALRHIAFIVPAGIGVQEVGFVMFGRLLGIDDDIALAVSMVKRARELAWGIPCLLTWQWLEVRRSMRMSAA